MKKAAKTLFSAALKFNEIERLAVVADAKFNADERTY
jgi:hypothetical protein